MNVCPDIATMKSYLSLKLLVSDTEILKGENNLATNICFPSGLAVYISGPLMDLLLLTNKLDGFIFMSTVLSWPPNCSNIKTGSEEELIENTSS